MSVEVETLKPPVLAGFGNPLLDMVVKLKDVKFYEKFNLKSDGQKEVPASELQSIYDYFKKENCQFQYRAGGCVQNTMRIFQSIIKAPGYSVMFGGIGNDEKGLILRKMVEDDGVITKYEQAEGYSTGTCIAIINGRDRSLVAHLGAADIYTVANFMKADNVALLDVVQVVYVEGFFVTHSFPVAVEVVRLCKAKGVVIVFNICGVYLFENNYKEILYMVSAADLVVGNADEYREFCKCFDLSISKLDLETILIRLQSVDKSSENADVAGGRSRLSVFGGKKNKILICTQGSETVVCAHGDKEILKVSPECVDQTLIKDTTGAGDSFVGGLLAGVVRNQCLQESIQQGCWAAAQVIQQVGCTFSNIDTTHTFNC